MNIEDPSPQFPEDETDGFVMPGQAPEVALTEEESQEFVAALHVGRREKMITVLGHELLIHTLTVDEELEVALAIKPWEKSQGYPRAYKTAVFAACVLEIDGQPLYTPLGSYDESFAKRFAESKKYYPVFLDQVYAEIIQLEQEVGSDLLGKLGKSEG